VHHPDGTDQGLLAGAVRQGERGRRGVVVEDPATTGEHERRNPAEAGFDIGPRSPRVVAHHPPRGRRELVEGPALTRHRRVGGDLTELDELLVVVDHRGCDAVGQAVEVVVGTERGQRAARVVVTEVDAAVLEQLVDRLDELVLVEEEEISSRGDEHVGRLGPGSEVGHHRGLVRPRLHPDGHLAVEGGEEGGHLSIARDLVDGADHPECEGLAGQLRRRGG
jgi:hypothetical protein